MMATLATKMDWRLDWRLEMDNSRILAESVQNQILLTKSLVMVGNRW